MNPIRFLLIFAVFIAANVYLFIRGRQALPENTGIQILYIFLFIFFSSSAFVGIFLGDRLPDWLSLLLEHTGGFYIILFVYLIALVIPADILRIIHHFFHIFPTWVTNHYQQIKLLYFAAVLLFLITISVIGFLRFNNPVVRELNVSTSKTSSSEDSLTIVAASDLHLGNVVRKNRLANWVSLINRQKPDIVLLAGDIFDRNYQSVIDQKMSNELGKLNATYGVYAVPGNHDYYTGIDKTLPYLEEAGIHVLRDETVLIHNKLIIAGRDDRTNTNRETLSQLMDSVNGNVPVIVLDHQPQSYEESVQQGADLHISGHTHDGQVFPYNKIVAKIYPLAYGYKEIHGTHVFVTSGLGLWGAPIRLGTHSEILKIHLQ